MGTVASTARIKLTGFSTDGVDAYSSLEDQVTLTYRAAYHYAGANGFNPYTHRGVPGRAGPMIMKRITDTLFDHPDKGVRDKINGLVSQVLRKTDAAVCVVHPADREQMPTWFVADKMPPNLTIVALSHAHADRTGAPLKTAPARGIIETYAERKLTPEEAGETMPPGEVTTKKAESKRTAEEIASPLKDLHERRSEEHRLLVAAVLNVVETHQPVAGSDVAALLGGNFHQTTIRGCLNELEADGKIIRRKEEDSERTIRGGGEYPKGGRTYLYGMSPGPVPLRTALPEGVSPKKGASEWVDERKRELDSWCDKVLEELGRSYPKGHNRPRSFGVLARATGLTEDQTRSAIQRLVSLDMVYESENGNGTYYLTDRRRGPKKATMPRYVNGSPAQNAERDAVPDHVPSTSHTMVPPDDLAAEVAALIARHVDTGEVAALKSENERLKGENERLQSAVASLKAALAALS